MAVIEIWRGEGPVPDGTTVPAAVAPERKGECHVRFGFHSLALGPIGLSRFPL